jgi:uncharacterized SAM-binding protein YcdF (DUF218 family)
LENQSSALRERPDDTQAIVVLAGEASYSHEPGGLAESNSDTLYRCIHAADLYHHVSRCIVLVSGGAIDPDSPGLTLAQVMQACFLQLGVRIEDIVMEGNSRNTYENAAESVTLLKQRCIRKVILVTDAVHMPRACGCFSKQGIEVVPAPCHFQADDLQGSLRDYAPNPDAVGACHDAAHEWLGIAWYWLHGWMG